MCLRVEGTPTQTIITINYTTGSNFKGANRANLSFVDSYSCMTREVQIPIIVTDMKFLNLDCF